MKIVLVNKSDKTGGAAIACKRLKKALHENKIYAKILVQEKLTNDKLTFLVLNGKFGKYYNFMLFALERFYFLFYEASKKVRFAFSPANVGLNIAKNSDYFKKFLQELEYIKYLVENRAIENNVLCKKLKSIYLNKYFK